MTGRIREKPLKREYPQIQEATKYIRRVSSLIVIIKQRQMKNLEDDVYNFGFILPESLVGPSVASRKFEFLINEMASFETEDESKKAVDPIVLASSSPESLSVIISISITKKRFVGDSWARASFEDVLWHLQYAAQVQANAQCPAEAVLLMKC